jgi:NSS family neurotransmitter:Na+ symporter
VLTAAALRDPDPAAHLLVFFADFRAAARFLFSIDWSKLTPAVVVTAFGQAFFSLGVGVGVLMMMGAYMKREYSITQRRADGGAGAGRCGVDRRTVDLPLVFSYGLEPTQGPGLIFVTLPIAFGQMPYGAIFGTLLFLLLSFAALTATIVIQEPIVAALEEYTKWSRRTLAYSTGFIIWLMGIVTVAVVSIAGATCIRCAGSASIQSARRSTSSTTSPRI